MDMSINSLSAENIEELNATRKKINDIDKQVLKLLNERANCSIEIGKIKASASANVFDAKREKELLDRLFSLNTESYGKLSNTHIQAIWREILSASRSMQQSLKAAYLGPEGTFSYYAGREFLGESAHLEPCTDFLEIFEKVYDGKCAVGVVPLENSLHGTVGTCFDLFGKIDVAIEAEFYSRISLSLLSSEKSLLNIKKVYSHAQPLGQASIWLRKHLPGAELVSVESTAVAATLASTQSASAAIGHVKLGEPLGLNVLASSIENDKKNWTRFVLITNKANANSRVSQSAVNKSSVLFTLKDKVGSLAEVLAFFANANINIQKLESRPMPGEFWKYLFFADLSCDMAERDELLNELNELCTSFKVLGSYPAGQEFKQS